MNNATITGRIAYFAGDGRENGRERFELIAHGGGHTLRAFCEMDDAALTRDVTLALDQEWHPRDGFVRITKRGAEAASLWFDVGETEVRLTGSIDGTRIVSPALAMPGRLAYLGLHPLQGDAVIVQARGTDRPGDFVAIPCATNSVSPDGDEAVGLRPVTIDVAYHGEETISVAAGTFAARRYALRWDPAWPPADLWVRAHDCVFLKLYWSHVPATYELTELSEADGVAARDLP